MKVSIKMNHTEEKQQCLQWQQIKTASTVISRRSCHSSCLYEDKLYIYGGYDNSAPQIINDLFCYSFAQGKWQEVPQKGQLPGPRHSHTSVTYKGKMYLFGGMYEFMNNTNQLHIYDFESNSWCLGVTSCTPPPPIDSHKCCLYQNQMIVGFGYSEHEYDSRLYSLNLDTLAWSTIFDAKTYNGPFPQSRTQSTFCIHKDEILIYGGKDAYHIYGDLWSFNLKTNKFHQIELNSKLQGRFGHSAVIFDEKLYIFGGTRGVTRERNDLVVIDLISKSITTCWTDSQEERKKVREETTSNPLLKKSRRDSAKKGINWSIFFDPPEQEESAPAKSPGKYRTQLKDSAYYNVLYDRQYEQNYGKKKMRKNPLLKEINRSRQQNQNNISLTATFELLTNSILLMTGKSSGKQEKNMIQCQFWKKIPKARDNSTADLRVNGDTIQMVIFGGGMHKINFNDLIKVDLKKLNQKHFAQIESD